MNEVVDSNGPQDASMEQATDQAATTEQPNPPLTSTMATEKTPESALVDGDVDETMLDAPAEPDVEGDSEAETLIQSPEKQRAAADNASATGSASATRTKDEESTTEVAATENENNTRKRKRSVEDDPAFSTSSRRSSPLSSPRIAHSPDSDSDVSNRIASRNTKPARRQPQIQAGDSDSPGEKPVKNQTRKRRPSDILPPISKHRTKNSSGGVDPGSTERRETRSATYPRHNSEGRSPSPKPQRREHRRGLSTQFTLGDVERKKRGRPPAIQTRRSGSADINRVESDSSDESDSPEQPRPALHKFSSLDQDTMSPAKATGPRKWRDKNGRTFLSRAASNNDVAMARIKFSERPEDLNMPDNAGNTPLQIAALQGYVDIVEFLLENGCDVDTRNIDKDTALIDAVENGHVEVVRLLLSHGANPRLGNAKGDEPYELVPTDDDNYEEIRRLLADAKNKPTSRRVSLEQADAPREGTSSRAASAASPRDSPPMIGPRSPPAGVGRRRTGRSESTRNDLLWQANTQENLKKLASQGDVQGVANILNVLQKAETESLIAAAKAGHEEVLQYLLAMGNTEPDPDPIRHLKLGYNTPLLAAIGRGHPEVVKLLVEQSGFNPMRKLFKGKSYFEVAAERRGENWQKEYGVLKTAYDKYAIKYRKATSPRASRDGEKLKARANRRSQSPISSKLRNSSSPTLTHKQLPGKSPRSSEKEKDRDTGSVEGPDKRKHHTSKRDIADSSVAVTSDQDQTVHAQRKGHIKRRSQSDFSQQSNLDPEITQRRRRLVTGKEHRRRKSNVEASTDEDMVSVKAESRPSTVLKRTRDSASPGRPVTEEGENGRSAAKKRRTVIESSPEETRPGPRRSSNLSSSPARERKAREEDMHKGEGTNPESVDKEVAPETMDVDKPETDIQTEVPDMPASAMPESDVPLQRTETTEEIKAEPVETGPTEAELELREEEEARRVEEAKRIEEERIAAEKAAEEQRLAEEAERVKKAEEEAALRKKEEAERQERARRDLEERQRRHEEQVKEQQRRQEEQLREQQRRERLEAENRRRDALPALLRHCALLVDDSDPKAKSEEWLKLFLPLNTVRSVQFDPTTPDVNKEDLWVPNFQVAGLLATKDLNLRNYTSLEKRAVTPHERERLWAVSRNSLAYEYQTNQWNTSIKQAIQREAEERPKFIAMEELFWVKLSDFEDQIFRHPHLAKLNITKQRIGLRVITSRQQSVNGQSPQSSASLPDLSNGNTSLLSNGINSHSSPTTNGNGNGYGYPRRES
ncbi:hypothetical protein H2200_007500 [Cladophialophora chaetospira]|uniref:Ankyrin repeat protein n=1 Tax=Cladophialophora chaetospira TaxID=386627 RepID=A0AA38X7X1_9EURO|nr:hypothetical protein H2200_007500 [Cladophialophora chaetospira]